MARAFGSYPKCRWFKSICRYQRPVGQEVKTPPFHGGIASSILARVTSSALDAIVSEAVFIVFMRKAPAVFRNQPETRQGIFFDNNHHDVGERPLKKATLCRRLSRRIFICRRLQRQLHPADDVILVFPVQLDKIAAPTPDPNDEIPVLLRVVLGVQEAVPVYGVDLDLVSAQEDVGADQRRHLGNTVRRAEEGVVKLDGQGAAVDRAGQVRFAEGFYHRYWSRTSTEEAGGKIGGDGFPGPAAVGSGSQVFCVPEVVHGRSGPGPEAATPVVAEPF